MRGVRRGFLQSEAELRIPKRNCVFRKIKMKVALRRDAMIMCRHSSFPYTSEDEVVCPPSGNPLSGATLPGAINKS